jgi:hypothetical protein
MLMSIQLPKPIIDYFTADQVNATTLVQCFTENAVVKDEKHTYTGSAEIHLWKDSTASKYQYTTTPFSIIEDSGKTIVTSLLACDFPGSPIDLRYIFELEGDKISTLEIRS